MSNQIGRKKRLILAASAVVLLVGLVTAPTFAAGTKTIKLDIIGPLANTTVDQIVYSQAPSNTSGNVFAVKMTNTTPGSSNPNSFTVTVPTGSPPGPFQITNVAYVPSSCTTDSSCGAFGVGSTNPNLSALFNWTSTTLSATGLDPVKQNQFVMLKVTVTTPSISTCPSEGPFAWSATGWTGTNLEGTQFSVNGGGGKSTLLTKACPAAPTIKIDNTSTVGTLGPLTTRTYSAIGDQITFYAAATGNPLPDITWQSSPDNSTWTNISPTTTDCPNPVARASSASCKFTTVVGSDGTYYRAKANNGVPDPTTSSDVFSNVIQIAYAAPCGRTVPESGGGTTAEVTLVKNPASTSGCTAKALSLSVTQKSVSIIPVGGTCTSILTCATYVVRTPWAPEAAATPVPATFVSPVGDPPGDAAQFAEEVWCSGTFNKNDLPTIVNTDTGNGGTYGMSMPAGNSWCLIQQISNPVGSGQIQVTEIHLLLGDAGAKRF